LLFLVIAIQSSFSISPEEILVVDYFRMLILSGGHKYLDPQIIRISFFEVNKSLQILSQFHYQQLKVLNDLILHLSN
jgi:hypothetical protein